MNLIKSLGINKAWRLYSAISFLNQIVRMPLLLVLATNSEFLEPYFIIAATSIPVQFIANDILQYKSLSHRLSIFERLGIPFFICASIVYVALQNGFIIGSFYVFYSLGLLFYGFSVGYLRNYLTPIRMVAVDAIYNSSYTILALSMPVFFNSGQELGYAVLLSQIVVALFMGLINILFLWKSSKLAVNRIDQEVMVPRHSNTSTPFALISIMVITQLERLVISASQPSILMCISLASSAVQALRKITMDDAIVFGALHGVAGHQLYSNMIKELKRARYFFYMPILLCVTVLFFMADVDIWRLDHKILPSIDNADLRAIFQILCLYLAATPVGIVVINTLRQRVVQLRKWGWITFFVIGAVELVGLVLGRRFNLAMLMIILTTSLWYTLFLTLAPERVKVVLKELYLDVLIFLSIAISIIWGFI